MRILRIVLPIAGWTLLVSLILFVVAYAADYVVIKYRIARNLNPYGNVTIQTYYLIPRKDGKFEYVFSDPTTEVCVHALFVQNGKRPCWYASRHNSKQIGP